MRRIILISFLFISFLAKAQQYTNFQGYGFKANRIWADSVSIQPSDTVKNKVAKSVAILNNKLYVADGTKWIIAGGGAVDTFSLSTRAWRQKGIDSVVGLLNNVTVDSFIYSTRAWRQKGIDSVQNNLTLGLAGKLNISDTASMLSPYSKLKSVGLTMPSAFSVANSPLTSNGTLAVTGAGTASQYVRGDGQLANFPSNGGGGSSVNYYLNGSVNQGSFGGTTYYQMSRNPILGTGTNFTINANGYIASFITDAGDPSLLNIPGGNWNLEFYFSSSSAGGTPNFYAELYKVSSSNVFTLIASGSTNPEGITNGTSVDQYFTSISVPQTSLLITDRIAIRIFVNHSSKTITLHTENSNLSEVLTTFSTGLNALNGLTSQVQYFATGTSGTDFNISSATATHTFNLPTASATNRGALSTTDWSTFNGKLGTGDTATMLTPYSRGSGTSGQVGYWNATRSLTGSSGFTFTPTTSLLLNNSVTAASAIARGQNITSTLTAAANNDVLVGLDVNPTFTNGAFTGVQNHAARIQGNTVIGATTYSTMLYSAIPKLFVNGGTYLNSTVLIGTNSIQFSGNNVTWEATGITNNLPEWRADATGVKFGNYSSLPLRISVNQTENARFFSTGNVAIGTTTDAGYKLDVNGTARFSDNVTISKTIDGITSLSLLNSSGGTTASSRFYIGNTSTQVGKLGSNYTTGSILKSGDLFMYNQTVGNITFWNNLSTGNINFTTGSGTTAQVTIASTGNLLINTTTDIASSKLTVESTTQGFLPPRMTTAQRDLISTPAAGLIIYNTSTNKHQGYNGSTWNDFY